MSQLLKNNINIRKISDLKLANALASNDENWYTNYNEKS